MEAKNLAEYMAPKYKMFDDEFTFVPNHMRSGIKLYIEKGIEPGSFLEAVITNNLKEAIGRADHINSQHLKSIVAWFYSCAPSGCWGHVENYRNWKGAMRGMVQDNEAA